MKTNKLLPKPLILAASVLVWFGLNLCAQPVITNQPASLTNLSGTTASFSVGVTGTGPFTYQWQFNGTNLPNNNTNIITTVAGKSGSGYSGDGSAATNANLCSPYSVTFDVFSNLYIADGGNNRIRMVDTNGIITTVAGKSGSGYSGDGGAATNAKLYSPSGVALDALGNLFIADQGNNRIRMVDTNGIITTVAGKSGSGYSGDGGAATNANLAVPSGVAFDVFGNLYIVDGGNNRIRKVDTNGIITTMAGKSGSGYSGDGGAATNANLYSPYGVTFDAYGNLFIADDNNNRVRKVDQNGIITTVAGRIGGGSYSGDGGAATNANLFFPSGVTFDASGNLFIADTLNQRIRKVLQYAGYPTLTIGNIGVTNAGNYTVVVTSSYGSVTSSIATLALAFPPVITNQPASLIAAVGSSPSFSVSVAGTAPFDYEWYFAGTNLVQSGTNSTLTLPNVSTNNAGNYMVMVTNNYGSVTSQVAALMLMVPPSVTIQPVSQTNAPGTAVTLSVAVAGVGPFTYQWQFNGTNLPNNIITTVAGTNYPGYSGDGVAATNTYLNSPNGVAFDAFGNLFIVDSQNERIRKVDTNGIITTVAGKGGSGSYSGDGGAATNANLNYPAGMTFDASGNLYIADEHNNRIRKVDTKGVITTVAGKSGAASYSGDGGVATNANLANPIGVAFDVFGNLFIADAGNNRIREVNTNGIITTVAGTNGYVVLYSGDGGAATNANLSFPTGMAFDAFGNLFIADEGNNRIRKVDTNGIITTVAGNGPSNNGLLHGSYSGDGGAATNATLYQPFSVAFDASGNLFISDALNSRIREVDTNGIITTVAGIGPSYPSSGRYSGDGGAATNAGLNLPGGVAFDVSDNLYIADSNNNRIREVHFAGYPAFALTNVSVTNAGNYTVVISNPYGSVTSAVANLTVPAPPAITSQPASQMVAPGSSPCFSVAVVGSGPFGYEWYFAATNLIQCGTDCTFTLTSVSTNDTGDYTVVITNSYGSVTSAVATLTVVPRTPPQIIAGGISFGFATNQFGFNISGAFGQTIVVDGSTNLVDWTPLFTNTAGNNPFYFFDPASTNLPGRFYRARLP